MPAYSYRAPSSRASSSSSETYEYDGMDDLVRKRDEAAALAGQKSAALYRGDIAGSLAANSRLRGLMSAISDYESGRVPTSRLRSRSSSSSTDYDGPTVSRNEERESVPVPDPEVPVFRPRRERVLGNPQNANNVA